MPTIDLGKVAGDKGTSVRNRGAWAVNTAYVNDLEYNDFVKYEGSMYACKISHTSGSVFEIDKWDLLVEKGEQGLKGDVGDIPIIKAGTATSLDSDSVPTVEAKTNEATHTTTFNFGIPKGDTSEIKIPTFDDSIENYESLDDANTAAETASNAIKSKVSIFTTLSNMKKSFSAIIQGLKILANNVGMIDGITSDLAGESETVAASIKAVNELNSNLIRIKEFKKDYKYTLDSNKLWI